MSLIVKTWIDLRFAFRRAAICERIMGEPEKVIDSARARARENVSGLVEALYKPFSVPENRKLRITMKARRVTCILIRSIVEINRPAQKVYASYSNNRRELRKNNKTVMTVNERMRE